MHGGLPVVVDGVNVGPEIQCRLHGLQHFALCSGVLAGRTGPESRSRHQRRRVILVRQQRVGAERSQRPHQLRVGGFGRQKERCRAEGIQTGQSQIHLFRHARVQVRSTRGKLLDQLDARHRSGPLRRRIVVAAARLADVGDHVQGRQTRDGGIRIGAGVQQGCRELVMSVGDSQHQRAGADRGRCAGSSPRRPCRLYGLVHIRTRLQESPYNAGAAFAHSE